MILGHLIQDDLFYERWQNTTIIIKDEKDEKVFELEYNAFLLSDEIGFINDDNEFTNEIYNFEVLSIEFLENETIIRIKKIEKIGE